MTNQPEPAPAVWIDGHPTLEAIAAAVWDRCGRSDSGMCVEDDPRNIAVAALTAVSAVAPATDRAALRENAAQAIRDAACPGNCGKTEEECARERIQPFAWHHGTLAVVEGTPEQFADAVLSALPATADRAAVLREAEAALRARGKRLAGEFNDSDVLHEDGPAATVATWKRAADLLRHMAAESVPAVAGHSDNETQDQAHEPHHRWIVEIRDGSEWMPATGFRTDRDQAAAQFRKASEQAPTFSDGTPVQRRFVRETTTYTVEPTPDQPAGGAQPKGARP